MLERFPQVEIDVFFGGGISIQGAGSIWVERKLIVLYQQFFLMDLDLFLLGDCFADSDPMG